MNLIVVIHLVENTEILLHEHVQIWIFTLFYRFFQSFFLMNINFFSNFINLGQLNINSILLTLISLPSCNMTLPLAVLLLFTNTLVLRTIINTVIFQEIIVLNRILKFRFNAAHISRQRLFIIKKVVLKFNIVERRRHIFAIKVCSHQQSFLLLLVSYWE